MLPSRCKWADLPRGPERNSEVELNWKYGAWNH